MSTISSHVRSTEAQPVLSSQLFSWCFLASCYWLLFGVCLDAWAHNHIPRLETFFTPWHAVLYSGLLATALALPGFILLQRLKGQSWQAAVPGGYSIAVFGIIGAFIGGLGDMTWHILFGIEQNIDAQFSPTHIALMLFFGFVLVGPYHALYTSARATPRLLLLLAFTLLLTYWGIISQTVHPYTAFFLTNTPASNGEGQILAVATYIIQGGFLAALTMYTVRRWRLFFGFFTCAFTISAIPLASMHDTFIVIPIGLVAGLLCDALYLFLKPSIVRKDHFRLFIAALPGVWLLTYTIALSIAYGTVWSVHMLFGSVFVVCLLCWLLSGLMVPLALPTNNSTREE